MGPRNWSMTVHMPLFGYAWPSSFAALTPHATSHPQAEEDCKVLLAAVHAERGVGDALVGAEERRRAELAAAEGKLHLAADELPKASSQQSMEHTAIGAYRHRRVAASCIKQQVTV